MNKYLLKFLLFLLLSFILYSCPESSSDSSGGDSGGESSGNTGEPGTPPPTTPPAAPSDLTLSAASFCRIIVNWNDNSNNESEFVIERSLDDTFSIFEEIQINANTSVHSDRYILNSETTYYYRIKAVNNIGDSNYSNVVNVATLSQPLAPTGSLVADHTVINMLRLGNIPFVAITDAKSNLHIAYGHTSHGSQLTNGMSGLVAFANGSGLTGFYSANINLFSWNRGGTGGALDLREGDGYGDGPMDHDCGYYPNWVEETREYLDDPANHEVNVIIWSWCGQAAGYNEATMNDAYLNPMTQLENDYPDIIFVYMTCHLNGTGTSGNLHLRNEQIRAYCAANNKWLFDFADIESYDPDGTYFGNMYPTDGCVYDANGNGTSEHSDETTPINGDANWALDWQASHTQNTDWYNCGAAHSVAVNANMKAYAAWWLWCRIAGWNP